MVCAMGTDYPFIFEQISAASRTEFRKKQADQIIEITQNLFHEIKLSVGCTESRMVYGMI
jgi:hypothetical protein